MFKIILEIEAKEHRDILALVTNIISLDLPYKYELENEIIDILKIVKLKEDDVNSLIIQEEEIKYQYELILLDALSIKGKKYLNLVLEYIKQTTNSYIYKDKVESLMTQLVYDCSIKENISSFVSYKIKKDDTLVNLKTVSSVEIKIKKEILSNSFKSVIIDKGIFDSISESLFETLAFSSSDGNYGIEYLSQGTNDNLHIFVNGLTNDSKDNSYKTWVEQSKGIIDDNDTLCGFNWPSGKEIISHFTELPDFTDMKKSVKLLTFARGLNIPFLVSSLGLQIISEWKQAKQNSEKFAKNLVKFIEEKIVENPKIKINLYGHSLGANLIVNTIEELIDKKTVIENVYLFGGASTIDEYSCLNLQKSVKNIYNFYSKNDMILEILYKMIEFKVPIGLIAINSKNIQNLSLGKVSNFDVSESINGHTDYIEKFNYLYKNISFYTMLDKR